MRTNEGVQEDGVESIMKLFRFLSDVDQRMQSRKKQKWIKDQMEIKLKFLLDYTMASNDIEYYKMEHVEGGPKFCGGLHRLVGLAGWPSLEEE